MKILFIGDIVATAGLKVLDEYLPYLKNKYQLDVIIANGENLSPNGRGITKAAAQSLWNHGIKVITSGNHVWDHDDIYDLLEKNNNGIIRPANYSDHLPGKGYYSLKVGTKNVTIINLCGQVFMDPITSCPFQTVDKILTEIPPNHYIIVDFHAEATSEKLAMGNYLAGKVSAVIGTHTHVQTSDAQIINHQTAYITDVGMTGSATGIIGMDCESVIKRFHTKMPIKLTVDTSVKQWQFSAVLIELHRDTMAAKSITTIHEKSAQY